MSDQRAAPTAGRRSPAGGAARFRRAFLRHVRERSLLAPGDTVVVACSGGLDSMVLLHLLRFSPELELRVQAAHFDHRMRTGSGLDALWLSGVARGWDVPLVVGEAGDVPGSEAEARLGRYRFLQEVRRGRGARWLATAHHADDQAETVLFRAARGAGPTGLAGIPEKSGEGLLRPLLPFRRRSLEAYAAGVRLAFRTDPTNRDTRFARNALRQEILPRLEEAVAPGAVRSLARLAAIVREDEAAWRSVMPGLLEPLLREAGSERLVLDRERWLATPTAVRARLLRELVGRLGIVQTEAGTRAALEFTSSGASGRGLRLPGGVVLAREFDRIVLTRLGPGRDESLEIAGPGEGSGSFVVGGRAHRVEWSRAGSAGGVWTESFPSDGIAFPLRWRGWRPGDRIRLRYGSKKIGKLFAEARVPAGDRARRPLLEDGAGRLIWVPGLARSDEVPPPDADERLTIGVTEIDPA